jgi:uncharacterized protein YaaW (UPF0174 family)
MVDPVVAATVAKADFDIAAFGVSKLTKAVQSLYGAAKGLNVYIDQHIETMQVSADESVAATGRVLEGAKQGLLVGYAAPVVIIAAGQLLLGNPLSAVGTVATAATLMNPVASTCAAVGAIWFGWKALSDAEQQAVLEKLSRGFELSVDVILTVINFALDMLKKALGSKQLEALRSRLVEFSSRLGRSLYSITGSLKDLVYSTAAYDDAVRQARTGPLSAVLEAMDRSTELEPLLIQSLKVGEEKAKGMTDQELKLAVLRELGEAASYSLPGARAPAYDDSVRIVARKLSLPTRAELRTEDLERAILFKVMERALEKMSDEERARLTAEVQAALRQRGIDRQVTYKELLGFVKFTAMDVGGTVGTLAMSASGLAGVVGLNALQYMVLQGIVITSGYWAATTAVLGLGMGGMMLAVAGAAGPIGAALVLLYTAYSLVGPAFRKLIPAICVIAAKRVELESRDPLSAADQSLAPE